MATTSTIDDGRRRAIARLNIIRAERGLDEDTWRDLVERESGVRSLRALSTPALGALIARLAASTPATARQVATGPYAGKLRALWITGWHLGIVRDRSDAALLAFVKRQTGLDHSRFLREPAAARAAIEGLKGWIARDGGVAWDDDVDNPRRPVVEAQWRLLTERGAVRAYLPGDRDGDALTRYAIAVVKKTALQFFTIEDWDAVIRALGNKIRNSEAQS